MVFIMIYIKSLLIVSAFLIPILNIQKKLSENNIILNKYSITLISIFLSTGVYISMIIGKFLLNMTSSICLNYLGLFILFILSLYYIFQYVYKIERKKHLDTSFYVEENKKYKMVINNPSIISIKTSSLIDILACFKLSLCITVNGFFMLFSCSLINISISLCILSAFIVSMFLFFIYDFIKNFYVTSFMINYEEIIISSILLILFLLNLFA